MHGPYRSVRYDAISRCRAGNSLSRPFARACATSAHLSRGAARACATFAQVCRTLAPVCATLAQVCKGLGEVRQTSGPVCEGLGQVCQTSGQVCGGAKQRDAGAASGAPVQPRASRGTARRGAKTARTIPRIRPPRGYGVPNSRFSRSQLISKRPRDSPATYHAPAKASSVRTASMAATNSGRGSRR